jgi:hypothetical protein
MRFYLVGITFLASAFEAALATEGDRVGYDDLNVQSKNAYRSVMLSCEEDVQLLCSPNQEVPFMSMLGFGDPFFEWILGGSVSSPMYSDLYMSPVLYIPSSSSSSYTYTYAPPSEMVGLDRLMDSMLSDLDVLTTTSSSYSLRASEPLATNTFFVFEDVEDENESDPFQTAPRGLIDDNKSTTTTTTVLLQNAGVGSEQIVAEVPRLASELRNYESSTANANTNANSNSLLQDAGIGTEQMIARRLTQEDPKNHPRRKVELPFSCKNHCLSKAVEQHMVSDQCANSVWLLEQTFALETEAKLRDEEEFANRLLLFSSGMSLMVLVILVARFFGSRRPSFRQRKLDQKVVNAVINNPSIRKQVELQISESIGHYDLVNSQTSQNPKTIVLLSKNNHDDADGLLAHNTTISRKQYVPPQIV